MKGSSLFLLGFGIFVVVLAAAAIIITVAGGNAPVKVLPESSPEGVVQRYLMAVKDKDFVKAYSYLSPESESGPYKNPYDNWIASARSSSNQSSWKASIITSTVRDTDAAVEVAVDIFSPGGLLEDPVRSNRITFTLQLAGGHWLIKSPIDLYWLY